MMNFNADSAANFEQLNLFDFERVQAKIRLIEFKLDSVLQLPTILPVKVMVADLVKRLDLISREPEKIRFLIRDALSHYYFGTKFTKKQHRFLFSVYRRIFASQA